MAPIWITAVAILLTPENPPLISQPEHFSGAVGNYMIAVEADRAQLQSEDPLIYTIRITANGLWWRPPKRLDLKRRPAFAKRFQIENLPSPNPILGEGRGGGTADKTWIFRYQLRPRSPAVNEIPSLAFVYYKPGKYDPGNGYRTALAHSIPLTVTARPNLNPLEISGPMPNQARPEQIYRFADGAAVLDGLRPMRPPSIFVLAGFLLAPPIFCAGWYLVWKKGNPDTARRARQQRSRAALEAFRALKGAPSTDTASWASWSGTAMTAYLRARFDLSAAEATPAEAAKCLERAGCSPDLAARVGNFFHVCDAARFSPVFHASQEHLIDTAESLISQLESDGTGLGNLDHPHGHRHAAQQGAD